MGSPCVPAIWSAQAGVEPKLGVLQIAEGICTGPREVANRFLVDLGDRDHSAIPRAGQAGQWPSISTVSCDPIARFVGDQRGCYDPAVVPCLGQLAGEPGATGASCRDEDEVVGLRVHLTKEVSNITLAGANAAEGGDLSTVILRHVGYGNRIFVDVHADEECARLRHR